MKENANTVRAPSLNERDIKPTIGIITALPHEYAAVKVLLESQHSISVPGRGAGRQYLYGKVPALNGNSHSIVLALLPDTGNNQASARAALLLEHFPSINTVIMSGIAGGVPNSNKPAEHVRLGDIVVSNREGVVQYDFGKEELEGGKVTFTPRHPPRPPSASLVETARLLQAGEMEGERPWIQYIKRGLERLLAARPSTETDVLASSINRNEVVPHPFDPRRMEDLPRVFLGPIASSNTLQKNPVKRDQLRDRFGVKAVEMEGSGIADAAWSVEVPYLVVRGICDYCDTNKGDDWQIYASVVAAAYTRVLLERTPLEGVLSHREKEEETKALGDTQTNAQLHDGCILLGSEPTADPDIKTINSLESIQGGYSSTVPQMPNQGRNLSASMQRQIKNVSIRSEIAIEAERVLGHVDYPGVMSLGGNLVDNPVWAEIQHNEQIRLTASRRPDADKCPLFMVLDLFLIRANDSVGSPLLLTKYDGRRAGWKAFLFPFRKRMDKENPTIRYSSNTKRVAELFRVPDNSVKVTSLGRQYLVSVKPHPGYSELYAYVFEFCSVELGSVYI